MRESGGKCRLVAIFTPTKLESRGQASTRCVKFHAVTLWDVYFRIRFPKRNIGGRVCLSFAGRISRPRAI
jgi:hypothetical protein